MTKFFFDEPFEGLRAPKWSPRADVYRTPSGWVVKFDLAGVEPQDLAVEARGSVVRVRGVRRDRFVERGFRHHTMEISYSRFERELRLPCVAEDAAISTEYSNGMLVVTIDTEDRKS